MTASRADWCTRFLDPRCHAVCLRNLDYGSILQFHPVRPSEAMYLLAKTALVAFLACAVSARQLTKAHIHALQSKAAERFAMPKVDVTAASSAGKNFTFKNPKASQFWVNGKTIPEVNLHFARVHVYMIKYLNQVDFDVGDSWSGLLPISSDPNETRKLFFWFFPPTSKGSTDDLIFW